MIRFRNVIKYFEEHTRVGDPNDIAIDDVTFTVEEGAFVFITGPSGAGKTTLIRLMYADLLPDSGEVSVHDRNLSDLRPRQLPLLRREIGVVHQDFHLIARKTAQENVALALLVKGIDRKQALSLADAALDRVHLTEHRNQLAIALSGGEKQRVAIARALVGSPRLLIADEPTGNLDPELSEDIFAIFDEASAQGVTVVVATHDALRLERANRPILYMNHGRVEGIHGEIRAVVQPARP